MLVSNAEQLIDGLEAERAFREEQQQNNKLREKCRFRSNAKIVDRRASFSQEERDAVEQDALQNLTQKLPGLNFYSAGFNGLLQSEIDRILRFKRGQNS